MIRRSFIPIVEGHGEQKALPLLVRRIFFEISPETYPEVHPPVRIKSGSFLNDPAYFGKYVSLVADKAANGQGEVIILLDCEDDCPAILGPSLLARAQNIRSDVPYHIVLAHREYETWFLASAESLRGHGLPDDVTPPADPEAIRGAKEWLGKAMDIPYDPIIHQAAFTAHFDIQQARSVPSFNRLITKLVS